AVGAISALSLHDVLPICVVAGQAPDDVHQADVEEAREPGALLGQEARALLVRAPVLEVHLAVGDVHVAAHEQRLALREQLRDETDRKSTRLNSSHVKTS